MTGDTPTLGHHHMDPWCRTATVLELALPLREGSLWQLRRSWCTPSRSWIIFLQVLTLPHLGVSIVYNGKSHQNGWFRGTTISGNHHFWCAFSWFGCGCQSQIRKHLNPVSTTWSWNLLRSGRSGLMISTLGNLWISFNDLWTIFELECRNNYILWNSIMLCVLIAYFFLGDSSMIIHHKSIDYP